MKFVAEMSREQLRAEAAAALAVLRIGATEQHGPHLPTGTDFFTVEMVARAAAEQVSAELNTWYQQPADLLAASSQYWGSLQGCSVPRRPS